MVLGPLESSAGNARGGNQQHDYEDGHDEYMITEKRLQDLRQKVGSIMRIFSGQQGHQESVSTQQVFQDLWQKVHHIERMLCVQLGNQESPDAGRVIEDLQQDLERIERLFTRQQRHMGIVVNASSSGRQVKLLNEPNSAHNRNMPSEELPPLVLMCVFCSKDATNRCMHCETPYCSRRCQQLDWNRRHKNVCHNLAASRSDVDSDEVPLQRPFSRNSNSENIQTNTRNPDTGTRDSVVNLRAAIRPSPSPGCRQRDGPSKDNSEWKPTSERSPTRKNDGDFYRRNNSAREDKKPFGDNNQNRNAKPGVKRDLRKTNQRDQQGYSGNASFSRKENIVAVPAGGDTSLTASLKRAEVVSQLPHMPPFKSMTNIPPLMALPIVDTSGRPRRAQVLEQEVNSVFPITVVTKKNFITGYTLVNEAVYRSLFEPLAAACLAQEVIESPAPGKFVCVLFEDAWFRAVYCPSDGYALVDLGQVVPSVAQVRAVPPDFQQMAEFCCEMKMLDDTKANSVEINASYTCKVVSKTNKFVTADLYPLQLEAEATLFPSSALCQVKMRQWMVTAGSGSAVNPVPAAVKASASEPVVAPRQAAATTATATSTSIPPVTCSPELPVDVSEVTPEPAVVASPVPITVASPVPTITADSPTFAVVTSLMPSKTISTPVEWLKLSGEQQVQLMHFSSDFCAFLRLADLNSVTEHDASIQDTALASLEAAPLSDPPKVGDVVIGKYCTEPFRAVVLTADPYNDHYKVVYIDYGNEEYIPLADMSVLPRELWPASRPILVARCALRGRDDTQLSRKCRPALNHYMDLLITERVVLKCTVLENGEVELKNTDSGESINALMEKHQQLKWKKQKANGEEVYGNETLSTKHLEECVKELAPGTVIKVVDTKFLELGIIDVRPLTYEHDPAPLMQQMREYCEDEWAGKQYVPKVGELCFIKCNDGEWRRATHTKTVKNQGDKLGATFALLDDDYSLVTVSFDNIRKAIEDFVVGHPRPKLTVKIEGLPVEQSDDSLMKMSAFLMAMEVFRCDSFAAGEDQPVVASASLIERLKSEGMV